jgi:cobalamin biosynthesis protein CobT
VVVDGGTSEATEIVWSTAQCGDAVPVRTVVLRPSWTSTVELSWSGLHSGLRCRPDARPVSAGSYRLQAAALTGEPAAVDFDLVDPLSLDRPVLEPATDDAPDTDDDAAGAQDQADEDASKRGRPAAKADEQAGPSGDDEQTGPDAAEAQDEDEDSPPQT